MKNAEGLCKWLHKELDQLPLVGYPFSLEKLPKNGIYFFYELGEVWGHGENRSRIVRVGTHKNGNFRSRIGEHFLLNERKMNFDSMRPAPKDRSIFRKNIGRALLNKEGSPYLKIWNIDFMPRSNRERCAHLRNVEYERKIERQITSILRRNFSFRFIVIQSQAERMGTKGLESKLIGTLGRCPVCQPSSNWLGKFSTEEKIRKSGLWLVQHLNSLPINHEDMRFIKISVARARL